MADLNPLIQYLGYQRHIMDYTAVIATTIIIYDYFLMLHLEIKFIWYSKWSYTTILFLLIRYLAFPITFLFLLAQTSLDLSSEMCSHLSAAVEWLVMIEVLLVDVVLFLRTWAVWHRNRVVGVLLVLLTIAYLVSQCYVTNRVLRSFVFSPPLYPGFRGCFTISADFIVWANYVSCASIEAIALVLMTISALRLYRQGSNGELGHVIHVDGIMYYVYLLIVNALNLTFMFTIPAGVKDILGVPLVSLYVVLTCRIVLNIRSVSHYRPSSRSELHTSFRGPTTSTLLFRQRDEDEHVQSYDLQPVTNDNGNTESA